MTQKEKQLLLLDLCARLPYEVFVEYDYGDGVKRATKFHGNYHYLMMSGKLQWKDFKPYLRPMSSMTEEERKEYDVLIRNCQEQDIADYNITILDDSQLVFVIDWLNAHHFDYRGLITMGLALEAPEGMYETK